MVDPQNMADDQNPPERPRSEPEIIPPGRSSGQSGNAGNPPWQATWQAGWGQNGGPDGNPDGPWRTQRVFVMRPGPLGFAVLMLALGLIAAAIVITLIGAFLIWIPVVALFVAGAALYRFLRR